MRILSHEFHTEVNVMRAPKKSWIAVLLLLAAFTLPAQVASAQQLNQEDYKVGLDKATAVYKSGDLVGALLGYLEVRGKFSGPEVDYSIARMYQKLHQCQDALVFYTFVMNGYDLPDDDPLFNKAATYYNELISCDTWGSVTLTCSSGTTLYINDDPVGGCLSRAYRMREGSHTFRLEMDGAEPAELKIRVRNGEEATGDLVVAAQVVERIVEVPVEVPGDGGGEPDWLSIGLIGGGGVLLASSALFNAAGYSALVDVQHAADRGDSAARSSAEDDVSFNKMMTGVTLGLGVAALGAGIALHVMDFGDSETDPTAEGAGIEVSVGPMHDGGAVILRGTF